MDINYSKFLTFKYHLGISLPMGLKYFWEHSVDFVKETVLNTEAGVKRASPSALHWIPFNKDTNRNSMWRMIASSCWNDRCYQLKRTRRVSSWGRLMMRNRGLLYPSPWITIIKVARVTVTSLISTKFLLAFFEWPSVCKQCTQHSFYSIFIEVNFFFQD